MKGRHVRHTGNGMLSMFDGDEEVREIGPTPGWNFRDRDEFIERFNRYDELRTAASGVGEVAFYVQPHLVSICKQISAVQKEHRVVVATEETASHTVPLYLHPGAEARDAERVTEIAGFSYPSLDGMLCDALPDGSGWHFLSAHVRKVNGNLRIDELIIRSEASGAKSPGTAKSEG